MSEGVALCRLSMYDLALDFLNLSLECGIFMSLEEREIQTRNLSSDMTIHQHGCGQYTSGGMGSVSVIH